MSPSLQAGKWALTVLAALAIQGCATESTGPSSAGSAVRASGVDGVSRAAEELQASRERWEARGVDDYRYTIRIACHCETPTVLVEVREGKAVSIAPVDGEREFRTEAVDSLDNFRELFDRIRAEIDSRPDVLKAGYDPEWGYPVYLHVDPSLDVADDERGFMVEKFEPLR